MQQDFTVFDYDIQRAICVASRYHKDQTRKMSGAPYIIHPFSVAWIVSRFSQDKDVFIAALLHDLLEDTEYTREMMISDFGEKVTHFVVSVSEDKTLSWKERKVRYIETLEDAPIESVLIAVADKIHNAKSLVFDSHSLETSPWGTFFKSKEDTLWFYGDMVLLAQKRLGNSPLVSELKKAFEELTYLV